MMTQLHLRFAFESNNSNTAREDLEIFSERVTQNTSVRILKSLYGQTIFLVLFLSPISAFAADGCEGMRADTSSQTQTLEGCFAAGGDPGSRSGCIMEVAANEKDVVLCDLIEIPGMVHDCIDGVAAVTTIVPERCQIMNEKISRGHCMRAAGHA